MLEMRHISVSDMDNNCYLLCDEEQGLLIDAASPHLTGQNFMATHWLITYALLAEDAASDGPAN